MRNHLDSSHHALVPFLSTSITSFHLFIVYAHLGSTHHLPIHHTSKLNSSQTTLFPDTRYAKANTNPTHTNTMQLSTLLPVLALLATPILAREPIDARRQLSRHSKHARSIDDVARHMDRREALAAENPKAGLRKVRKRGANGCRVKGSSFSASAAAASGNATSPASSSAIAASSAVVSVAAASSAAPSSAAAAAASDVGGQNWAAPVSHSRSLDCATLTSVRRRRDLRRPGLFCRRPGSVVRRARLGPRYWRYHPRRYQGRSFRCRHARRLWLAHLLVLELRIDP